MAFRSLFHRDSPLLRRFGLRSLSVRYVQDYFPDVSCPLLSAPMATHDNAIAGDVLGFMHLDRAQMTARNATITGG